MNIIETNLSFESLSRRKKTNRIILHHTATASETVEQIHHYHKKTRGWAGIGYHLYVRKDGNIYRGRPIDTVGAHASGNNSDAIGVCFEGNFETETMPEVQKQAGKELIASLKKQYGIDKVQRHRDVGTTACPGKNFPFAEIANISADEAPETENVQSGAGNVSSASGSKYIKNDKVRVWQEAMNIAFDGVDRLEVDGSFGPASQAFANKHQIYKGIKHCVTGVRWVQAQVGVNQDGSFGPDTHNAVVAYQKSQNLKKTNGYVGLETTTAMLR